jgi:hypothetical protein
VLDPEEGGEGRMNRGDLIEFFYEEEERNVCGIFIDMKFDRAISIVSGPAALNYMVGILDNSGSINYYPVWCESKEPRIISRGT